MNTRDVYVASVLAECLNDAIKSFDYRLEDLVPFIKLFIDTVGVSDVNGFLFTVLSKLEHEYQLPMEKIFMEQFHYTLNNNQNN